MPEIIRWDNPKSEGEGISPASSIILISKSTFRIVSAEISPDVWYLSQLFVARAAAAQIKRARNTTDWRNGFPKSEVHTRRRRSRCIEWREITPGSETRYVMVRWARVAVEGGIRADRARNALYRGASELADIDALRRTFVSSYLDIYDDWTALRSGFRVRYHRTLGGRLDERTYTDGSLIMELTSLYDSKLPTVFSIEIQVLSTVRTASRNILRFSYFRASFA